MGIRDRELERVIKYAEGLGVKVIKKKHKRGDPGAVWDTNTQVITIYIWNKQPKVSIILNLLHELGHHMDWVYSDKHTDPELIKALQADDNRTAEDPPLSVEWRHLIYQSECEGIKYMSVLAKELNLTIPLDRVEVDADIDRWFYYEYYINGEYPTNRALRAKKKELLRKMREARGRNS